MKNEMRNEMDREQIIKIAANETVIAEARDEVIATIECYEFAAKVALDIAGFSDGTTADSPRPVSNSPRETGKNSEFGPTELR